MSQILVHFLQNPLKCLVIVKILWLKELPLTDYLTEQEQIQQLKSWIKQYGPTILGGVLLALALTYGWHYWQNYQNRIMTHASLIYDEMLGMRAQDNADGSTTQAKKLISDYPKTPYASMAALLLAREAVKKNNYAEAISRLNWVIDHSKSKSLREIARLRIARILVAEQKPSEALNLLKIIDDNDYAGLADETKGDAYLAMNDQPSARQAYASALKKLPQAQSTRPLLQMKYDNLANS